MTICGTLKGTFYSVRSAVTYLIHARILICSSCLALRVPPIPTRPLVVIFMMSPVKLAFLGSLEETLRLWLNFMYYLRGVLPLSVRVIHAKVLIIVDDVTRTTWLAQAWASNSSIFMLKLYCVVQVS